MSSNRLNSSASLLDFISGLPLFFKVVKPFEAHPFSLIKVTDGVTCAVPDNTAACAKGQLEVAGPASPSAAKLLNGTVLAELAVFEAVRFWEAKGYALDSESMTLDLLAHLAYRATGKDWKARTAQNRDINYTHFLGCVGSNSDSALAVEFANKALAG